MQHSEKQSGNTGRTSKPRSARSRQRPTGTVPPASSASILSPQYTGTTASPAASVNRQSGSAGEPASRKAIEANMRILTEDVITLNEAVRELPTRTHLSTAYRWVHRGIRGHKLATVKIGSQIVTSRQAMTRFLRAINS